MDLAPASRLQYRIRCLQTVVTINNTETTNRTNHITNPGITHNAILEARATSAALSDKRKTAGLHATRRRNVTKQQNNSGIDYTDDLIGPPANTLLKWKEPILRLGPTMMIPTKTICKN